MPKEFKLPKYVKLGSSELRLQDDTYFRDAGIWDVNFEVRDGKLFSVSKDHPHLDGIELVRITKKEWQAGNRGYINKK